LPSISASGTPYTPAGRDPRTMGKWVLPEVSGVAPSPRGGLACVAIGTKVVIFGGSDRAPMPFDDLWVLETADNTKMEWTKVTPSYKAGCRIMPRSGSTLSAVNGKLYLYGGQEPVTEHRFADIKCLDPECWEWSDVEAKGTVPPARHSHVCSVIAGQAMLIYGGSSVQGTLSDLWLFNVTAGMWQHISPQGTPPAAREMHSSCMLGETTMLVYGGRAADGRILCDAAVLDTGSMEWGAVEPTPFSRCAHSTVSLPGGAGAGPMRSPPNDSASDVPPTASTSGSTGGGAVIVYGGFSGEAVEGDVMSIDSKTLEIELLRRGPRETDAAGTVPLPRFAHAATIIDWSDGHKAMLVIGGVNLHEDLNDVAVWTSR